MSKVRLHLPYWMSCGKRVVKHDWMKVLNPALMEVIKVEFGIGFSTCIIWHIFLYFCIE